MWSPEQATSKNVYYTRESVLSELSVLYVVIEDVLESYLEGTNDTTKTQGLKLEDGFVKYINSIQKLRLLQDRYTQVNRLRVLVSSYVSNRINQINQISSQVARSLSPMKYRGIAEGYQGISSTFLELINHPVIVEYTSNKLPHLGVVDLSKVKVSWFSGIEMVVPESRADAILPVQFNMDFSDLYRLKTHSDFYPEMKAILDELELLVNLLKYIDVTLPKIMHVNKVVKIESESKLSPEQARNQDYIIGNKFFFWGTFLAIATMLLPISHKVLYSFTNLTSKPRSNDSNSAENITQTGLSDQELANFLTKIGQLELVNHVFGDKKTYFSIERFNPAVDLPSNPTEQKRFKSNIGLVLEFQTDQIIEQQDAENIIMKLKKEFNFKYIQVVPTHSGTQLKLICIFNSIK